MYCIECGSRLIGNEKYCSNCGSMVDSNSKVDSSLESDNLSVKRDGDKSSSIAFGVLSIIGSSLIIFSPIALVFSIIGLILGIRVNKRVGNLLGIVLNAIGLCLSLLTFLIIILGLYFSWNIVGGSINDLWNQDSYYEEDMYYDNDRDF